MGIMDRLRGKTNAARERFNELKRAERNGTLDDKAKAELEDLRSRFKG